MEAVQKVLLPSADHDDDLELHSALGTAAAACSLLHGTLRRGFARMSARILLLFVAIASSPRERVPPCHRAAMISRGPARCRPPPSPTARR